MAKRCAVQDPEDNYELREKVHKTDKYDISVMNDVVAFGRRIWSCFYDPQCSSQQRVGVRVRVSSSVRVAVRFGSL